MFPAYSSLMVCRWLLHHSSHEKELDPCAHYKESWPEPEESIQMSEMGRMSYQHLITSLRTVQPSENLVSKCERILSHGTFFHD
jgi:hypothetical protein